MSIGYKLYPKHWKTEIRPSILKRAKNCCEKCGLKNYTYGFRDLNPMWLFWNDVLNEIDNH